jgi:hypothetical protein
LPQNALCSGPNLRTCTLESVIGYRANSAGSQLISGGMTADAMGKNMLDIESDIRDES